MLYPQSNPFRQCITLPGFWDFRFDPDDVGTDAGWGEGFSGGRPIAVPASWNDQFEDRRDYLGPAWYQVDFDRPWGWEAKHVILRFGSVNYLAEVLTRYIEILDSKPFVVGQHVWNLCDFKTGQAVHRIGGMNLKGVFTRDRRPKLAAHRLRELWTNKASSQ